MHAPHHDLPRRVLGDNCDECVERSLTIEGLASLDNSNLQKLAELAAEMDTTPHARPQELGASYADAKAVENLRLAARLTYRSGISPDVAA